MIEASPCICLLNMSHPPIPHRLILPQSSYVIPWYSQLTPSQFLTWKPINIVTVIITTLMTAESTPMIDIFCRRPISFLRMKNRLTIIAPPVTHIRINYPESTYMYLGSYRSQSPCLHLVRRLLLRKDQQEVELQISRRWPGSIQ